jgi:hypothetical protein
MDERLSNLTLNEFDLNEDPIYDELVRYGITVDISEESTTHPLSIDVSLTYQQPKEPSIQKHAYLSAATSKAELIIAKCKFCEVNQINTVINPCMHACLCVECAKNYAGLCPLCFALVKHIDNMFLSYVEVDVEVKSKKRKVY